jgi:hypothetical protein
MKPVKGSLQGYSLCTIKKSILRLIITTVNNKSRSPSFGCHIAVGDVAPAFCVRQMSGGEEVKLPCLRRVVVIPHRCPVFQ